ncbi:MAG: hypothetical protein KC493_14585 [Bacteriovoracaceae bacterium]|nr:hypothetical protein [Bacteriovoracaceae bacterium]
MCTGLLCQIQLSFEYKDIDTHLGEFSKYNVTHHDNIDDEVTDHVHKHKHSQDGEEHDHNHDHTKVSQYEVKVLDNSQNLIYFLAIPKSKNNFSYRILISSPHPFGIFRPPIS